MVQKTRATEPVRVALVSLGCAKNLIDSEVILGRVGAGPYQIVRDPEAADVAVVNTCGFIDAAREESLRTIEEMLLLKRRGVLQGVLVAGCMVKRFRDELLTKLPEVDAFLDISDYADVVGAIEGLRRGRRVKHLRGGRAKSGTTDLGRALLTPEHFAYLRVSEGCDYKCTFCVIPHIRGLHVSKPLPVLAQEAAELAELGVKEIALVGEDITSYGKDIGLRGGLVPLLQALSLVEGIEWIRLLYTHPLSFPDALLDELEHNRKLVPYVDMPIQHIDDEILKRMKRGTPRKLIEERIATLRARIPGIALRTTLIVGFPGETDAAFESLLAFLAQAQFERLGCFTYSPEQGSAAALLDDDVPRAVKEARRARVMDLQRRLIDERNARLEGSVVRVIVDRLGDQGPIGRTQADAPDIDCAILLAGDAAPGEIRDARVVGRSGYDLRGTLL